MRAETTVDTITGHVTKWLNTKGPGLALGVDHSQVRLAILSEDGTLGGEGPAATAYSVDQRVFYRCRDGVPRRATVVAMHDNSKTADRRAWRYTIAVDRDSRTAMPDELFPSFPPPPGPRRHAATPIEHNQLREGSRVWYDSAHVNAPCRARIDGVQSGGQFVVTLEGEERETTGSQLMPLAAQSSMELPSSQTQWAEAEVHHILRDFNMTARDADLFNQMARIVVVTDGEDGIDRYWDEWYVLRSRSELRVAA